MGPRIADTPRSRELESLTVVANALASETDLAAFLDLVSRRLLELLDVRAVVVFLPHGPGALRIAAGAGEGAALIGETDVDNPALRRLGARPVLWLPLLVYGRPVGVLAAYDKLSSDDALFGGDDLRLAETYAAHAAVAVDLSERVARDTLRHVVDAQELERRRLARDLHDDTGQALTSILLGLRSIQIVDGDAERAALEDVRRLTVETLQDVRRMAVELRPKALDDFGLVAAVDRLAGNFREQTGLSVDFVSGFGDDELPAEVATALYRIVQEALANVNTHAQARTVSILLTRKNGGVMLVIEDDGRGFDPLTPAAGFGLRGMRERVALLGGSFQVESSAGAGATLAVEVSGP